MSFQKWPFNIVSRSKDLKSGSPIMGLTGLHSVIVSGTFICLSVLTLSLFADPATGRLAAEAAQLYRSPQLRANEPYSRVRFRAPNTDDFSRTPGRPSPGPHTPDLLHSRRTRVKNTAKQPNRQKPSAATITDSRWLQLEVCREYQRNKCSRPDTDCKFAHPAANVEVQNGRVTACYDSIKGRCNREKPPCKYFHPPQHLKDQLLINGRNHLALKNALMQQMSMAASQQIVPGQVPAAVAAPTAYLTGIPGASPQVGNTYTPYFSAAGPLIGPTTIITSDPNNPLAMAVQQTMVTQQKMPRNDRLDMDMKAVGTFYYENFAFPGMMQTPVAIINNCFSRSCQPCLLHRRASPGINTMTAIQKSTRVTVPYIHRMYELL
ncbi:Zinc finger, CCCH-type [Cinara cedri]|uniref:Zinc finger, CCCH-type n=1 Tax=Cinara cedri TaxID=506608 RepID=A0A5E4MC37_9HEMI|nr:Zinc finger, CCCH-type [Cinara cedri]